MKRSASRWSENRGHHHFRRVQSPPQHFVPPRTFATWLPAPENVTTNSSPGRNCKTPRAETSGEKLAAVHFLFCQTTFSPRAFRRQTFCNFWSNGTEVGNPLSVSRSRNRLSSLSPPLSIFSAPQSLILALWRKILF